MPPLIGWAAASGRLNSEAWTLYAILFLWQFPHFMAIAWMYREDDDRAGYLILPKGNLRFPVVALQTVVPLLALIPITSMSWHMRYAGSFRWIGFLLSLGFLYIGLQFVLQRSKSAARQKRLRTWQTRELFKKAHHDSSQLSAPD
jgi:protoheme IX farnesyltransferase